MPRNKLVRPTKRMFFFRLLELGACVGGAAKFDNKYLTEIWDELDDKWDAQWLLDVLHAEEYLHSEHFNPYSGYSETLKNAIRHADPKPRTRRTVLRYGREVVEAIQTLFSFDQISRAMRRIKLDDNTVRYYLGRYPDRWNDPDHKNYRDW